MLRTWGNFVWFTQHFFSLPTLVSTLFSPWKRMKIEKGGALSTNFFEDLLVNIIMRIVGAVVRIILITIGLVFLSIVVVLGIITFVFWFIAPIAVVVLFIYGLTMIQNII